MNKRYGFAILLAIFALASILSVKAAYRKPADYGPNRPPALILPGEFERQQAIWMQWPGPGYSAAGDPVYPVFIDIIKALDPYIRVNLMVQSQEQGQQIAQLLKSAGYRGLNLRYYPIDHQSIWCRDVGPVFVKDGQGRLRVVDFGFNDYGRNQDQAFISLESQIDRRVAELLQLPAVATSLISEGGGVESNGRGTLMITEAVALDRNPGMTKAQIENEYRRVLGAKKIIWLKQGLAEDDLITKGHINEIARFVGPNTILLAQVLPEDRDTNSTSQESYQRLEENYRILSSSTDQDGKPFRIIRIPMPPTLYAEVDASGKIPVRSYLNYALTNGVVLMPTYWKPGRSDQLKATEDQVKRTLESVFPGRRVIGINAESVNFWGGGIHCITQHMPAA